MTHINLLCITMKPIFSDLLFLVLFTVPFVLYLAKIARGSFAELPAHLSAEENSLRELYQTATELYDQDNYEAAAATAMIVAAQEDNPALAFDAANLVAKCEAQLGNYEAAEEYLQQALHLATSSPKANTTDMQEVRLYSLGQLSELYLNQSKDEQAWAVLSEAKVLAESAQIAENPQFKKLILGPIYHNLAILHERAHDWSEATKYYWLAREIWEKSPELDSRRQASHEAYMLCGKKAAQKMFDAPE